jgi:sigma-B regulation protein RsbU (phosphoserine phosphatase)
MTEKQDYKTLEYHHKLAHRAWLNKAAIKGFPQSENISELVWELMLLFPDADKSFDLVQDDIYATAAEIAECALETLRTRQVMELYRDLVVDAIMQFTGARPDQCLATIRFSNIISDAIANSSMARLKHIMRTRQAESQSSEMRMAKRIQRALLPKSIPEIPGFEFAGRLTAADEVGGDYWSVKLHQSTGIVTMKLADISGHGVAAATLVAAVKFISGGYYQGAANASSVMEKTNRVLTQETPHEILVSMVYGWLNPGTRELSLVNAGLESVFACGRDMCTDIYPTGPVMGFDEDAEYTEIKLQLKEGDVVFFGSDGITEAGLGEAFGMERLKDLVVNNSNLKANEIADLVVKTVMEYSKVQRDDISTLVLKVTD